MTTRAIILAAAVTLALPLGVGSALAQNTGNYGLGTTYRLDNAKGPAKKKAAAAPHAAPHHAAAAHHAAPVADSTDALNGASLAAAKQGQSYVPAVTGDPNMKKKL